ncbi:AraC family transcriptional regulator [Bradyrhizobium sp. LA6.7]|uniref:helix-turn-helix transcriptional regulator n=1 Tax=unclassified Bradyrhizobium TaxID=2631580 RepID=UPI003391C5A1
MKRRDDMRLWRDASLPEGLELLRASCVDHRYPAHDHDEFVVAAFKSGAQRHRISRHEGVAYAGMVMIIPPGEVHTGEAAVRGEIWEYCAYYPSPALLERIADDVHGGGGGLDFGRERLQIDPTVAQILLNAHRVIEVATDPLEKQSVLLDALGLLIHKYGQRTRRGPRPSALDADIGRAIAFIHEHHARSLTVGEIADVAGLSEYHFMRTFRATRGLPVHRYLTQLRLDRAKSLLQRGVSASETALAVGLFDQSHLTNLFRKNFGVTPRAFALACGPHQLDS